MNNELTISENTLNQAIQSAWSSQKLEEHLDAMVAEAANIAKSAHKRGDECFKDFEGDAPSVDSYIGTYLFPERVKSFLVLWRDVLFEQQKAEMLRLEGDVAASDSKALNEASKVTIEAAADSLADYFSKEKNKIANQKGGIEKAIDQWKLQSNPWATYREQLETLAKQCEEMRTGQKTLKEVSGAFKNIESISKSTISDCLEDLNRWASKAEEVIAYIEDAAEKKAEPTKIANYIDGLKEEVVIANRLAMLTNSIDEYVDGMPEKMRVPMGTHDGMVQYRDVTFQRSVKQWIDSEVTPLMYEAWEETENSGNSFKMALINILNRTVLLSNQAKEGKPIELNAAELNQPLQSFLKKVAHFRQSLRELQKILQNRLKTNFRFSEVYNAKEEFLAVPLQSTMRQYRIDRNRVMSDFQVWWQKQTSWVRNLIQRVEQEDAYSTSEKIVRFVTSRKAAESNTMYNNIFQTSGYIGESFWVGRKRELEHMEQIVENWKKGFRGSVALTGDRFSGKSLFGELVANRFFSTNSIRLSPNTLIKFAGRHIETTTNLAEAITFVKKHSINNKVLIWLDDLELWQDREVPLNQNVRALKKAMTNGGGQVFYMVSMSSWLKKRLSSLHDFQGMFQSEINLNRMSLAEVREAILIRHGATHKNLVEEKNEEQEVSSNGFFKMTRQVYNAVNGNIGDALNLWTSSIQKVDDENVIFQSKVAYPFPNFINSENGLLLSTILLAKSINEYDLRKVFGPAFKEKYKNTLQQLLSIGVLERQIDGKLEISAEAVNEVGRVLEQEKYL